MKKKPEKFYTARGYEMENKTLTPSMEDYLEMIYRLNQKNNNISVYDLAENLNVSPPSVTKMIQKLDKKKLVNYEKYGLINLTETGVEKGKYFIKRHNTIKEFLNLIGNYENIHKDVENIEHHISLNTFKKLSLFVSFLKENNYILDEFNEYKNKKK